jgi:hypothetical protein
MVSPRGWWEAEERARQLSAFEIRERVACLENPLGNDDRPYGAVLEAIRDGWRVIKFPEQALMLDESRTCALGAEFVLER